MKDLFRKYDTFVLLAFLAITYCIFIGVHKDFGISWDEAIQREHGLVTLDYINEACNDCISSENISDTLLQEYKWKYYGTIFQVISQFAEEILGYGETAERFYLRHRIQLAFFIIALFCFYTFSKLRFKDPFLAFCGLLILLSTPRLLGHQFFNPKDAVFLSGYVIAISSLIHLIYNHKNWKYYLLHAFCTGLVVDIRILGLFLIPLTILGLLLANKGLKDIKNLLIKSGTYLLLSCFFMILMWPLLWSNPIENLMGAFKDMSAFNWGGEVLLHGKYLMGNNLPPDYIPQWIMVTSPILALALILFGILSYLSIRILKTRFSFDKERSISSPNWRQETSDLICFLAAIGPIVLVILLKSTLYDGWRQIHFVYPMFIYFILFLIYQFGRSQFKEIRWMGSGLLVLLVLIQFKSIWTWHPLQHVYFNGLAKKPWVENYELDYWGSGFKYAYEEYAQTLAPGEEVGIFSNAYPGWESYLALSDLNKEKLSYEWEEEKREVYVSNYRYRKELEPFLKKSPPFNNEVFVIKRKGEVIYGFYKIERKENISE